MSKIENIELEITELNRLRGVWVYLPDNYDEHGAPLPVIYMHDGQNLFYDRLTAFGKSWGVDKTLDKLFAETGESCIVVGVESNDKYRLSEYSPWKIDTFAFRQKRTLARNRHNRGGDGRKYGEWFAKTLKPYVDSHYNTDRERIATAVAGSSMGGYISCYLGLNYQRIYETMGLFSTHTIFNERAFYKFEKNTSQALPQHAMVYVGGKEWGDERRDKQYVAKSRKLYDRLVKRGISCEFVVNSNFNHYESSWEVYFGKFARDFLARYYDYKQKEQNS